MAGHGEDNSLKAVIVAVAVNAFITVAKFVGWLITWSPALLAEAIHSAADVGNQVMLWVGIRKSAKAATPEHPYGWGPARYLWNLKSAMGIFFLGCGVTMYHGLHALEEAIAHGGHSAGQATAAVGEAATRVAEAAGPEAVEAAGSAASHGDGGMVGIIILIVAFVLEGYSLLVAYKGVNKARGAVPWREFMAKGDDPTGVGVLLEDGAAVFGVVLALAGVVLSELLHSPYPEAIATLSIGLLLGYLAFFLARANGRLLIGAAVSPDLEQRIREALLADELVEGVEDFKTTVLGQGRFRIKCEVDLYEKLIAVRMREGLREDCQRLADGEERMKVLVDVVGRAVRTTGREIQRLETVVREVAPTAAHIDLELL